MKNIAKIGIIALAAFGCEKAERFSDIPYVELRSYEIVAANVDPEVPGQHVKVDLYFTDGDGNIGLEPTDTVGPPHCNTCAHYDNLFVSVNGKIDGQFEKDYDYNARIKNLTPNAQNKTLEGNITYKIDIANRTSDTIMLDFYIEDRALNKSNKEHTPELYIDL